MQKMQRKTNMKKQNTPMYIEQNERK